MSQITTYGIGGYDPAKPNANAVEQWDDDTRIYSKFTAPTSTRPYTAAENAVADARIAAATADTNSGTLTAQAIAAIAANVTWIANTAPQVQTGVDAIQARTYPAKPADPTTVAQVAAILTAQYNNILTPLVVDLKELSRAVETLNAELVATKRQLNATMRLVAGALDSTSGT